MRALILSALILGCSSDPEPSNTTTDTGTATADTESTDTSTTDTGTATTDTKPADVATDTFGMACNTVVQKATAITQTAKTGAAPTFTGGTISDGTYVMTKWEVTTPAATSVKETLVVTGGKWEIVADLGTVNARSNFDVKPMGTKITLTPTCPSGGKAQDSPYTATATTIISGKADGSEVVTFTKL